jgi:hypothetical protein
LIERESKSVTQAFGRRCHPLVLGLNDGAALTADQELPGMRMIGVLAWAGCSLL